jgi:hypothetical protein
MKLLNVKEASENKSELKLTKVLVGVCSSDSNGEEIQEKLAQRTYVACEDGCLLGCSAAYPGRSLPLFQRCLVQLHYQETRLTILCHCIVL